MSLIERFKDFGKSLVERPKRTFIGIATFGTLMIASVEKANAQYIRFDSNSPTNKTVDFYNPSLGLRFVKSWTKEKGNYSGFYIDADWSLMAQNLKGDDTRFGFQTTLNGNLAVGTNNSVGIKAGGYFEYSNDFTSLVSVNGAPKTPHDVETSFGVQAGAFVRVAKFIKLEGLYKIDTQGRQGASVGVNILIPSF